MYSLHTSPAPIAAKTLPSTSQRRVNQAHETVDGSIPEAISGGASKDRRDERHTSPFQLAHPRAFGASNEQATGQTRYTLHALYLAYILLYGAWEEARCSPTC